MRFQLLRQYPRTTDCSHFTVFLVELCKPTRSFRRISFSFAAMRLPIVFRAAMKYPVS